MLAALEVHLERSIENIVNVSTAVIFGTIVGDAEGPLIDVDAPDGRLYRLGAYEVRVDELIGPFTSKLG